MLGIFALIGIVGWQSYKYQKLEIGLLYRLLRPCVGVTLIERISQWSGSVSIKFCLVSSFHNNVF